MKMIIITKLSNISVLRAFGCRKAGMSTQYRPSILDRTFSNSCDSISVRFNCRAIAGLCRERWDFVAGFLGRSCTGGTPWMVVIIAVTSCTMHFASPRQRNCVYDSSLDAQAKMDRVFPIVMIKFDLNHQHLAAIRPQGRGA